MYFEGENMTIRRRASKKAKNGYVYEVNFQYKHLGVTEHYWKGGFKTKQEAQDHEDLKKAELCIYGKPLKECKKTLKQIYDEFMVVAESEYQHNTIYNTKKVLHHWNGKDAVVDLGRMRIADINYNVLQNYFNLRKQCGKAINEDIKSCLGRIFKYAIRQGYIQSSPLEYVRVQGIEVKKEKHVLTYLEYFSILEALKNKNTFDWDAIAMAVQIGFYTGMRISEVMALHKDDFDFDNDLIYVHRKLIYKGLSQGEFRAVNQMKSKKSKAYIPMPKDLKEAILEWFKINPYDRVICNEDGNYFNPDSVGNRLRNVSNQLGIPFHFHLLRHTYTTYLVNAHVDVKVAQELLRHANFNTTMTVYAHVENEKKKSIVNTVFGENLAKMHKNKNTLS